MKEKDYSLQTLEQELIEELEDNKEEILESNGDYLIEYVHSNISVYTYEQIMIYANNSDLWHMESTLGGTTIQQQIVEVIFEHLSGVAYKWLDEKQQELEEAEE
tara:strand:+ start:164 stop:475 length:312 start_codon:yes stop_codon:yes gene_type:complete